jgi:hypothetical protein
VPASKEPDVKRRLIAVLLFSVITVALPRAAAADATAFLGLGTSPTTRSARGFAIGAGLLILALEFEYSSTAQDPNTNSPSLRVGSFNGLLQTPFEIAGIQFYATAGGGIFREVLGTAATTNFAVNTGGGAKISLVGPLRLRVDYRVFKLNGSPLHSRPQRFYVGLNLKF